MIINKLKVHFTNSFRLVILLVVSFSILSGCSPHPGAGNWQADGSNTLKISRIVVAFEGRADFYTDANDKSIRRCFWAGTDKNSIQMKCVHAENTDIEETYEFTILETGQAKLSQDKQLIGLFTL